MTNIKKITLLFIIVVLSIQCSKENEFLIEKGRVGLINKETTVKDLKTIFENDSIVSIISSESTSPNNLFFGGSDKYDVYSKDGEKLLEIVPEKKQDSTSKIKSIEIFNSKYKTSNGLSLKSIFKDIHKNYTINNVETTLTSATLYVDELNATISFDKEDLGISKFSRAEITVDQIPDNSKIKYLTIWFN
jgi:hypothetical protein